MNVRVAAFLLFASVGAIAAACSDSESSTSGGADASTTADASTSSDAATQTDSAAPTDAGADAPTNGADYYELGAARTTPQLKQCQTGGGGYIIVGSASNRTSLAFYFQAQPAPGSFTVEPLADAGPPAYNVPASATGALVLYTSDPQGGPEARYYAQSGTVTVTSEGGKLRAVATNLSAIDIKSSTAGTIGGQITCP